MHQCTALADPRPEATTRRCGDCANLRASYLLRSDGSTKTVYYCCRDATEREATGPACQHFEAAPLYQDRRVAQLAHSGPDQRSPTTTR